MNIAPSAPAAQRLVQRQREEGVSLLSEAVMLNRVVS